MAKFPLSALIGYVKLRAVNERGRTSCAPPPREPNQMLSPDAPFRLGHPRSG